MNSPGPFFSIVIPNYNRAALVAQAIDSVLAQEYEHFEIIVVDDGSTDASPDAVRRYGDKVRLIQQSNRGPAAARNKGIAAARGEYVAFLDSDDLWFPWTLSCYRHAIEACDRPAGLMGTPVHFDDVGELSSVSHQMPQVDCYRDYLAAYENPFYRGSGVSAWRADVLRTAGGFFDREPIYGEDIELFMRLGTASRFAQIRQPSTIAVRRHAGGSIGNIERHFRGAVRVLEQERAGKYPGGARRRQCRASYAAGHAMLITLHCIRAGERSKALWLYLNSIRPALACGRYKYLLGLPLVLMFPKLNPIATNTG